MIRSLAIAAVALVGFAAPASAAPPGGDVYRGGPVVISASCPGVQVTITVPVVGAAYLRVPGLVEVAFIGESQVSSNGVPSRTAFVSMPPGDYMAEVRADGYPYELSGFLRFSVPDCNGPTPSAVLPATGSHVGLLAVLAAISLGLGLALVIVDGKVA